MIVHPPRDLPTDEPFVFAALGGFTCSICAPGKITKADIEAFATRSLPGAMGGWCAVDKSKMGIGGPTPNPCNHDPARQHWFLLDGVNAARLGYETKK